MHYKNTLTLLLLALSLTLFGQELPYTFSTTTAGTYTPLTDATVVNTDGVWDDPDYQVPIGFDFPLFGSTTTNTLYFEGFVGPILRTDEVESPVVLLYGADLIDRGTNEGTSLSPILYKVDGTAPNRIFKLEYQNAGFFNEVSSGGMGTSFVNCQLWLYEVNGLIEFYYGPSNIESGNVIFIGNLNGPIVGLLDTYNVNTFESGTIWYLEGEQANPGIAMLTGDLDVPTALNSTPEANRVYTFTPLGVSAVDENILAAGMEVFPNPVADQLQLKLDLNETPDQLQVRMFNALGQQVYHKNLGRTTQENFVIDMVHLPKGTYMVQLYDGETQFTKRIVKQ